MSDNSADATLKIFECSVIFVFSSTFVDRESQLACLQSNGGSNPEVVGSIPAEVKRFSLYLVWFPDSLY